MHSILRPVLLGHLSVPIISHCEEELLMDYPSIIMTVSDYLQKRLPRKRKANELQEASPSRCVFHSSKESDKDSEGTDDTYEEMETDMDYSVFVPLQVEQLTTEMEVKVYTGLPSTETFKFLGGGGGGGNLT